MNTCSCLMTILFLNETREILWNVPTAFKFRVPNFSSIIFTAVFRCRSYLKTITTDGRKMTGCWEKWVQTCRQPTPALIEQRVVQISIFHLFCNGVQRVEEIRIVLQVRPFAAFLDTRHDSLRFTPDHDIRRRRAKHMHVSD